MDRLGEEVREALRRFEPAPGMADLVAVWARAVGDEIARHAWPSRVARDGTLHVATSSSAWALELTLLEQKVLERLTTELGRAAPARVRFAPGVLPEPDVPETNSSPGIRATADPRDRQRAAELAATIADENLRKLVAKAAAASLARGVSDRDV